MLTASSTATIIGRLRTLALAGTVAIGAMIPAAPATFASYEDGTPAVTVTRPDQFDIAPDAGLVGLTAVVQTGTGGADLLADPDHDAEVLRRLDDGTEVNLRVDVADTVYDDDGATRWWPVEIDGEEGWISGFFLVDPDQQPTQSPVRDPKNGDDDTPPATPNRIPYDYTGSMVAEVSADGDGLVMRAEPDASAEVVTNLKDGTIVDLRIDVLDTVYDAQGTRWWPVSYEGDEGWVSGFYLIEPGTEPEVVDDEPAAPTPTTTPAPTEEPGAEDGLTVGEWAVIGTLDGDGVNLRSAPNAEASQTGFAPNQGLVEILSDPGNGWFEVRWDDQVGYIDGDLLTEAEPPQRADRPVQTPAPTVAPDETETPDEDDIETPVATETPVPTEAPVTDAEWVEGDEVEVVSTSGVGVNIRAEPGIDAERAGFLANGEIVEVTAGPVEDDDGNPWYAITDGDQSGWVRADLLGAPGQADAPQDDEDTDGDTPPVNGATGFIMPLQGYRFTQDYGCSSLGFYSYDPAWGCPVHDGVDFAAASGTPLVAVGAGEVVAAGWCDCGLGYYVEIDHGSGLHTVYGHMASQPYVSVGQQVSQGETLGPLGSSGISTGPHVHFMVRLNGVTQDPKDYLPAFS